MAVAKIDGMAQLFQGKVAGVNPGVELLNAEVDGIGAIFYGGFQAFEIAGRRQQFRSPAYILCAQS